MGSYIPCAQTERDEMLKEIGCGSIKELYADVPPDMFAKKLQIPEGISELELRQKIDEIASKNTVFKSIFRGAGAYHRFIPSLVKTVMNKEQFVTSYTPYQAEIAQGVLQSIFEYQTCVCELFGLDTSNASLYDGATAAAEAVIMCQERRRHSVVISGAMHPQLIATVKTYCKSRHIPVNVIAAKDGKTDIAEFKSALNEESACGIFAQPNYFGQLEESAELIEAIHAVGASAVVSADAISLGMLEAPGILGADICVSEGQSLGLPMSFGGPYLGMIACTEKLRRKLPGRIVGQTTDEKGNRMYVLTLQAREQHIRREKASSNICSNQALCALGALTYMCVMGPDGLAEVASQSYSKAHYAADEICKINGFELCFEGDFFNEFVTTCPGSAGGAGSAGSAGSAAKLNELLSRHGILGPLELDGERLLWCVTEMNTKQQIDRLVEILGENHGSSF